MIIEIDGTPHRIVVSESDCSPCPYCTRPFCPICYDHYEDCDCPEPDSLEGEEETEHTITYAEAMDKGLLLDTY